MKSSLKLFVFVILGVVAVGTASAQQKTGETWRSTSSLEMTDASTRSKTAEVCLPDSGNLFDEMLRQRSDDACQPANIRRDSSKLSFDVKCGEGNDDMEGHMELETLGDKMHGTFNLKTPGSAITIRIEGTKLGQACDAVQSMERFKNLEMPKEIKLEF